MNATAELLEKHINSLLIKQESPIAQYLYYQIASDTGISEETVRDLCYGIDGGWNGFTVIREDLDFEQAMDMINQVKTLPRSE